MPLEDGLEMIVKAFKKKDEERVWQMYLMQYQHMTDESFVSFDKFYSPESVQSNVQSVNESKSVDEILDEVESILKMKGMKKNGNI